MNVSPAHGTSHSENLPVLPYEAWNPTRATLHLWTQIVGKVRLHQTPLVNHWWNVPLYVTARGLTTSPMPYGDRTLEIIFDFIAHKLLVETSDGTRRELPLKPQSVADFYANLMATLDELGMPVKIWTVPCELPYTPIPFEKDTQHASYDAEAAQKFWRILVWADEVLKEFRASFVGKASPVHFFWGSFDLAVTRFSGRRAPENPGADRVTREAYSHEVSSAGFWPGDERYPQAVFYAYAAPEPGGFATRKVNPAQAFYHPEIKEFLLNYDDVRTAAAPKAALIEFLETTYAAAADLGNWDRKALER